MDDVNPSITYLSTVLAHLADPDPNHHYWRMLDHKGLPTKKEIIKAKKELDKAFDKWLTP